MSIIMMNILTIIYSITHFSLIVLRCRFTLDFFYSRLTTVTKTSLLLHDFFINSQIGKRSRFYELIEKKSLDRKVKKVQNILLGKKRKI